MRRRRRSRVFWICGFLWLLCEACRARSCGMMTWMTSQGWTRSRILSVHIPWQHEFRCERSGWGHFAKPSDLEADRRVCRAVDTLHAVALKVEQQQRKVDLPDSRLQPEQGWRVITRFFTKQDEMNLTLFLLTVTAVPRVRRQLAVQQ